MSEPHDAPGPQGGTPDPAHRDPATGAGDDDAATWGGEGGAGSHRGSPLTNVPLPNAEKKEG
jgi:hypothetical protein